MWSQLWQWRDSSWAHYELGLDLDSGATRFEEDRNGWGQAADYSCLLWDLIGDFLPVNWFTKENHHAATHTISSPRDGISHKHWFTEETMLQYISNIIVPYVENLLGDQKPALVIINNFKGQIMAAVNAALEQHDIQEGWCYWKDVLEKGSQVEKVIVKGEDI